MNNRRDLIIACVLALVGAVLFLPGLGAVHLFDWDEINFAEISREMLITGDYFRAHIDFEPFWEKPPLFFWLQSSCMRVFGVNEFAARLPNALLGCMTLPLLYFTGKRLYDGSFGLLWACLYAGSFLPHFYFKSGIIDPLFNTWIMLAVVCIAAYYHRTPAIPNQESHNQQPSNQNSINQVTTDQTTNSQMPLLLGGVFIGLAVLTKGPVGLLLPLLTWLIFWLVGVVRGLGTKARITFPIASSPIITFPIVETPIVLATALVVSLAWYGMELWRHGWWFFQEFFNYQLRLLTTGDSGHKQPFFYHFLVVLIGCFPASAFAFTAMKSTQDDSDSLAQNAFRVWMLCLLSVVLGVFTIVQTKIVHYSSLAYFPVTFLGAYTLHSLIKRKQVLSKFAIIVLAIVGALWSFLLTAIPLIGMNKDRLLSLIRDEFAKANLQASVVWSGFEVLIGVGYACGVAVAVFFALRAKYFEMTLTLVAATAAATFTFLVVIAPKIEGYTQRSTIEFYQALQGEECYVHVLGFKSYAHLFYTHKQPSQSPSGANIPADEFEEWLLEGDIDKPAYFVCKITSAEEWRRHPHLRELYARNGFVFFKRDISLRRRVAHHKR